MIFGPIKRLKAWFGLIPKASAGDVYSETLSDQATAASSITDHQTVLFRSPILDNFNRADANSLGDNWSPGFGGQLGVFGISNNRMDIYSQVSGYTQAYWNQATFGPNAEAYIKVASWGDGAARLNIGIKCANPDSTTEQSAYTGTVHGSNYSTEAYRNTVCLKYVTDSETVVIGNEYVPLSVSPADGDEFGVTYVDEVLAVWHKPVSTGVWYCAHQAVDTRYQNQLGYIIVYSQASSGGANVLYEDFGGGNCLIGIVESLFDQASTVTSVTDLQAFIESLSDTITAQTDISEVRQILESLSNTIISVTNVQSVQVYVETLSTIAQSATSVADIAVYAENLSAVASSVTSLSAFQTYVESLSEVVASVDSVSDVLAVVETLTTTITSVSSVTDAIGLVEILTATIASSATLADLQAYAESLSNTIASVTSASDLQTFIQDLQILIASQTSITEIQAFIEQVYETAISSSSLTEVLVGVFLGAYLRGCEVPQRYLTKDTPPRVFTQEVPQRLFTKEVPRW